MHIMVNQSDFDEAYFHWLHGATIWQRDALGFLKELGIEVEGTE